MRVWLMSAIYARNLHTDIARLFLLFVLGIEAIYLSDKLLTDLLLAAIDYGQGLGFLIATTVLASPGMLMQGLPLALTMAVFLVLLRRREAGDFVVLAPVGFSPHSVIGLCMALGTWAAGLALLVGGLVAPLAEYRLGQAVHQARYAVLTTANPGMRNVIEFDGATILFQRRQDEADDGAARVFLHVPQPDGAMQVITARDSHLRFDLPGQDGTLLLGDAQVITFGAAPAPDLRLTLTAAARHMTYRPGLFVVPAYPGRDAAPMTLTLPELLRHPASDDSAARATALQILLAAAVTFLAPLVAAAAMGLTRGPLIPLAGPAAVGLMLAAGFAIAPLAGALAGLGLAQGLALALGGGLGLALAFAAALICLGDALLAPAGLRL